MPVARATPPSFTSSFTAGQPIVTSGTNLSISVDATDAAGAANLIYSWKVTSAPADAQPSFALNNANSARNNVVQFSKAGQYEFQVTAINQAGLQATQTVSVLVNQNQTFIEVQSNNGKVLSTSESIKVHAKAR